MKNKIYTLTFLLILVLNSLYTFSEDNYPSYFLENHDGLTFLSNTNTPYSGINTTKGKDGRISSITSYLNGLKHGDSFVFYENGQIWKKIQYKNGKIHGDYIFYYENGNIDFTNSFFDGQPISQKNYYKNGNLKFEFSYLDSYVHGTYTAYFINGAKAYVGYKEKGKFEGKVKYFNRNGSLLAIETYELGKLKNLKGYYNDGDIWIDEYFSNGYFQSEKFREYDENGNSITNNSRSLYLINMDAFTSELDDDLIINIFNRLYVDFPPS